MNWYEEKQAAKRERLEARADKLEAEGRARVERAHDAFSAIPFGQPILVGHHSEKRDRAYRARASGNIDKGCELIDKAAHARSRADNIGKGGISSDDPDAPAKLSERIAALEALQASMVAANKVVRAFWKAGHRAENTDAELRRYFEKMADTGLPDDVRTLGARNLLRPDFAGRIGFASYQLTNNSGNIRRLKQRLAELTRHGDRVTTTEEVQGVTIVRNAEANRLQLIFPGKPPAAARALLKRHGFRWAPSEGAWQRQLNSAAEFALTGVLAGLGG